MSWKKNLERRGGFYGDTYWYDYNLSRRMPLVKPMIEELVASLPPCSEQKVLDLCSGSGNLAECVLHAYPSISNLVLLDSSAERLQIAKTRVEAVPSKASINLLEYVIDLSNQSKLPDGPYNLIVGSLALHPLIEKPAHYATKGVKSNENSTSSDSYESLFKILYNSLSPKGHLIFGDHVGQLSLYEQLVMMTKVGFIEVDCSWRQSDFFIAGGRRP